jgi:phage terminase large subunit GpA-like protein
MTVTAVERIFNEGLKSAIPEGEITISQWAERYRFVSPQRSARPGRWNNAVVPFAAGIMDAVTEPDVRKVVFQKSSQVAGTEILINILCYFIHIDPSLMLYIAEIEDKAKAWTQEAFDPTIAESPELKKCMLDFGGKSAHDNQRIKRFRGGQLTIGWASSPAQLSSRPARIVCFDEVDAFEPTSEGDAVKLAEARTKTFGDSKKIILVSSPRDKEGSVIEREYLLGDQREFWVPCPHCGEFQTLKWGGKDAAFGVKWDVGESELAWYVCEANACVIEQDEKHEMLAKGRWISGSDFNGTASFKISEIYSPFTNWGDMAAAWVEAKKYRDTLKVFVNTSLGETWQDEESFELLDIQLHQENYSHEVPDGVLVLTAGVDVQGDRLEYEVVGWGQCRESWSIDYGTIEGSPSMPNVWEDLEDVLTRAYEGSRSFRIASVCIDSGGGHTDDVYAFCKKHKGRRWFPVKGLSTPGNPIVSKGSLVGKQKVRLWTVGTDTAKDEVFSFLGVQDEGTPGYCHFPNDDRYGESYIKQLCSERKISRFKMGREYHIYEKIRAGIRNEALDLRVYATAARAIILPNFDKWAEREATRKRPSRAAQPTDPQDPQTESTSVEKPVENPEPAKNPTRFRVRNNPFS